LTRGDAPGYRRDLLRCIELGRATDAPGERWVALHVGSSLALFEGRLADAEAGLMESFRLGQRLNLPWAGAAFLGGVLELSRCRGSLDAIAGSVEQVFPAFPGPSNYLRVLTIALPAEIGEAEEVRSQFLAWAAEGFDRIASDQEALLVFCGLAEGAHALGAREPAEQLLARLEPHADQHALIWGINIYQGPVSLRIAKLSEVLGREADALAYAKTAVETVVAMGARAWEVRARLYYAELLAKHGSLDAAGEQDAAVFALAAELGMGEAVEQARAQQESLRGG
jgi:hypothetical protein